jgi:hypothetical protein
VELGSALRDRCGGTLRGAGEGDLAR